MGYNKIILHGNQMCDYLYIQNAPADASKFGYVNAEPEQWFDDTMLFSTFNDVNSKITVNGDNMEYLIYDNNSQTVESYNYDKRQYLGGRWMLVKIPVGENWFINRLHNLKLTMCLCFSKGDTVTMYVTPLAKVDYDIAIEAIVMGGTTTGFVAPSEVDTANKKQITRKSNGQGHFETSLTSSNYSTEHYQDGYLYLAIEFVSSGGNSAYLRAGCAELNTLELSGEKKMGYIKELSAGDTGLTNNIIGYEIRRKNGASSYTEYVATIKDSLEDMKAKKYVIDYMAANNSDYTYYLFPISSSSNNGIILSPSVTDEINTDWGYWSLLVVDETDEENVFYLNKMFKFELNLQTGERNNNAVVSVIQNFTKYPTVQYGMSNYWSSDLTSLCGFISCNDVDYVQTPNMIEELKALTSDTRRKFLKDIDGNVWEVKITAPISISTDDSTSQRVKTVKVSWTEVGDASGISIINNPDTPSTSWILTETGEVLPYLDYVWDEHYRWNNDYKWTAKEDALGIKLSNMSREFDIKEG